MPELRSTYGPHTPSDMWSLPQDVTIETDPLRLEGWFLLSGAGVGGAAGMEAGIHPVWPSRVMEMT